MFISLGGFELFLWVWFEILSVLWRKRGSLALFADVKDPIIILAVLFGVVGLVFALDLLYRSRVRSAVGALRSSKLVV